MLAHEPNAVHSYDPNAAYDQLLPARPPLVIFKEYVRDQMSPLLLDSVSFESADHFSVVDKSGAVLLQGIGKEWSTRNKKTIYRPDGQALFEVRDDMFTHHRTLTAIRNAETLFKVHYHASETKGKDTFTATIHEPISRTHIDLEIVGNWLQNRATFRRAPNGALLAKLSRSNLQVDFVEVAASRKHVREERIEAKYRLDVAAGVDIAIVASICMCCEAIHAQVADSSK